VIITLRGILGGIDADHLGVIVISDIDVGMSLTGFQRQAPAPMAWRRFDFALLFFAPDNPAPEAVLTRASSCAESCLVCSAAGTKFGNDKVSRRNFSYSFRCASVHSALASGH